jgi:phosphoserine phosphatase
MSRPSDRAQDLHRILEVTRAMVATTDLDALLGLVVDTSRELLGAQRASVFLYDRDNGQLVTRVATGVDEIRIPADTGISGATIQGGESILVPDAYADERFNQQVDRDTGYRTRNIISTPLRGHDGQLVGVLQVINRVDGDFSAADVTLAETFGAQAGVALQRANLLAHYEQKLAMERAMALAREIQQDLLPARAPQIEAFDVAGFTRPADQTGGDIYDFFPLSDDRWMIVVADATGHGIGPALVISETRAMLRAVARQQDSVGDIMGSVNRLLVEDLDAARFVTCFVGIVDPANRQLTFSSAGHGPILHFRHAGEHVEVVQANGVPLGILPEAEYGQVRRFQMEPLDMLLVTTDGFSEARDPAGEMFGSERIVKLCRSLHHKTSRELIDTLVRRVDGFVAGGVQADDLTAVAIRRLATGGEG